MLFTTASLKDSAHSANRLLHQEARSTLVSPIASDAYQQGRAAFLAGESRTSNPYHDHFLTEHDIVWTSEDCWDFGWDFEKELTIV